MTTLQSILNLQNPTNYTTENILKLLDVTEDEIKDMLKSANLTEDRINRMLSDASGYKERFADILNLIGMSNYDLSNKMIKKRIGQLIRPWDLDEFSLTRVKVNYRTFAMDYENMKKLPEKVEFSFDPKGNYFNNYFGMDISSENKIVLQNQPNDGLTSIAFGKSPIESIVYAIIESGKDIMPDRIRHIRGNVDVQEDKPILYCWIPSKKSERFKGHIQIILPNNLVYSR